MKSVGSESRVAKSGRYAELKRILEERRREILSEVQEKMRDVRAFGASGEGQGVLDAAETSEADIQDDIAFAVRCKDCEEAREMAEQRERQFAQRRSSGFLLDLN